MSKKLFYAKTITRFASLYNASALIFFLVPGGLEFLGVQSPYSSFWRVLPALLASFAGITLWVSAGNIQQLGIFPVWNGTIRIIFAVIALSMGYAAVVGQFILVLAIGDLLIGLLCIVIVKRAVSKSYIDLLFNR